MTAVGTEMCGQFFVSSLEAGVMDWGDTQSDLLSLMAEQLLVSLKAVSFLPMETTVFACVYSCPQKSILVIVSMN